MEVSLIHHDIEGDLIQYSINDKMHFAKRLQLKNAYHISLFEEIEIYSGDVVARTDQRMEENYLDIVYNENLIPLSAGVLTEILRPDGILGLWRLCRFALDIAETLKNMHDGGIPQTLVYPPRVGVLDKKFTIIPTISGILPSFEEIHRSFPQEWLYFVAPEIIRTRAFDDHLIKKADIFSFGKMLQLIACGFCELNSFDNMLQEIDRLVENQKVMLNCTLYETCKELHPLISGMCSLNSGERPDLDQVIAELQSVYLAQDPGKKLHEILTINDPGQIASFTEELNYEFPYGLFDFYEGNKYLILKDVELSRNPAEYTMAISYLNKYLNLFPDNIDILLEIAGIYRKNESYGTHIENSTKYFEWAGKLSDWRKDAVSGLAEVLKDHPRPEKRIAITNTIPLGKRIPEIFRIRTDAFIQLNKFREAWFEITALADRFETGDREVSLAQEIADQINYGELLLWIKNKKYTSDRKFGFLVQAAYNSISKTRSMN